MHLRALSRSRLPIDTIEMARFLIGKLLVRDTPEGRVTGRIVETEAYPPGDASGHAFRGETAANRAMFLEPGRSYVYFIYGVHFMLNVSAEPARIGGGVLFRAVEPVDGIPLMQARRGPVRLRDLARGPGRLAQALAVGPELNGVDMCEEGPIWLADAPGPVGEIGSSIRIGITKEAHQLRRYFEQGNPYVSGRAALNARI